MRWLKDTFMRRSKLFKGELRLNHDISEIESKIDTLLQDINLKKYLSKKLVRNFNQLDIEVVIALVTANIETAKAIQFGLAFLALVFTSLTGILLYLSDNALAAYIFVLGTATISLTIIEWSYRNKLMNYTYLKELLMIYKGEKSKVKK